MMRLSRILSIVCVGFMASAGSSAQASGSIYEVALNDIIHRVTAELVVQTIQEADENDAALVLIRLQTPGGTYSSTRLIVETILNSKTPVVVYVSPSGAHAASAGFLILLSSDVAAMAPGTNTGAATPISGSGQDLQETLEKKATSDAAAYARSLAERRGRSPELAEKAVTETLSWTASEALEAGLIDYVANTEADLLELLHGSVVKRVDGSEVTLSTSNAPVVVKEMTTKQRLLSYIANPNIAVFLGLIGLAGLYLEFSNPGTLVPGIVGAIALLLAAFAFEILPVNIVGLLLLIVGFGMLIVEALTPSFGALGAGGIAGIVLGALMLFEEQPIPTPALQVSWSMILPVAVVLAIVVIFIGRKVIEAQRRPPVTGSEGLVGQIGTALTDIGERGKVFIHGEYWDARSIEPISKDERVRVSRVNGLKLIVERVAEP
ncbi:MAG TPA: nodulation protein NfeD [Vicinamibacteria bacterium]|nr:nodulation protein NfeD [Vicinamibacteria bacterium]